MSLAAPSSSPCQSAGQSDQIEIHRFTARSHTQASDP
jgi:hypothetical protein